MCSKGLDGLLPTNGLPLHLFLVNLLKPMGDDSSSFLSIVGVNGGSSVVAPPQTSNVDSQVYSVRLNSLGVSASVAHSRIRSHTGNAQPSIIRSSSKPLGIVEPRTEARKKRHIPTVGTRRSCLLYTSPSPRD